MKKEYVKPVATKIEIQLDENIADSTGYARDETSFSYTVGDPGNCFENVVGVYNLQNYSTADDRYAEIYGMTGTISTLKRLNIDGWQEVENTYNSIMVSCH